MKLETLLQSIKDFRVSGRTDLEVTQVVSDSRQVTPGSLFVAIAGQRNNGHLFVSEAAARGAVGVVVNHPVETVAPATVIEVNDPRHALALLAAKFYANPSAKLRVIGVTGTNGKTTTTYLVRQILKSAGRRVGLLGTVVYEMEGEEFPAPYTTPDPLMLQSCLARMVDRGIQDVVMEVSSHALEMNRVSGCEFDVAVFTNLTQDHLDFHRTMDRYFSAKEQLFLKLGQGEKKIESKRALINRDDPWGQRLLHHHQAPAWTYGLSPSANIWAEGVRSSLQGLQFMAHTPAGKIAIRSPLLGAYNVSNILAAIGVGLHCGLRLEIVRKGISDLWLVPGRFERVEAGQDFSIIVDYAHTESALARLLESVASLTRGRIITVFGCGGDRDQSKRVPMGRAAARASDWVIVTSDNPRSENPRSIIEQIEMGVQEAIRESDQATRYDIVLDRRRAIEKAVTMARQGDVVVIAGKGHENYQLINNERLTFDDCAVAREMIRKVLGAFT